MNIINMVKTDYKYIKYTYNLLLKFNKLGIETHKAGEWILDNLYIIQNQTFSVLSCLKNTKINSLKSKDGKYRIIEMCSKYVKESIGENTEEKICSFFANYEKTEYLTLDEIWAIPVALKVCYIHEIRNICQQIVYADMQKYKVEKIIQSYILDNRNSKFKKCFKRENNRDINKPFIEYMAYRLSESRYDSYEYVQALDEIVAYVGTTVDEVVQKEHLDISNKQITIGNYILSLKNVDSIDYKNIVSKASQIDNILKTEEAGIYVKQDKETLEMYRNKVKEIADKYKISEKYICNKIVELCKGKKGRRAHSGYYILDEGKNELYKSLGIKTNRISKCKKNNIKLGLYVSFVIMMAYARSMLFMYYTNHLNTILDVIYVIFLIIPISQITIEIINSLILFKVKPKMLPAIEYKEKVEDNCKTLVIIPTLLTSTDRVKELINELERMYLLNKQENIFFALIGDCSEIDKEHIELDDEIIKIGKENIDILNNKYNFKIPKFYFTYRKRRYNEGQGKYLGWERKRGLITQLNRYILYGETSDYIYNNLDLNKIGKIKYILTVDADTKVNINSISKMVGIISHPLNAPILNKDKTLVIDGHALIQPRVSSSIDSTTNIFTLLWNGYGGLSSYNNVTSDLYQDIWDEGTYIGKGIYDVEIFSNILDKQIPENTVLSHDLLEGSYLRAGLATNVELLDGFPNGLNRYVVRENRWLRGDIQILKWLNSKVLTPLAKWKIIDNIRRGLLQISMFLCIFIGLGILNIKWYWILSIYLLVYMLPSLLQCILYNTRRDKHSYIYKLTDVQRSFFQSILTLSFLPYLAINNLITFIKTLYRMRISKKYMLEWMTAEQAEKMLGKDIKTYINNMWYSPLFGIGLLCITLFNGYTQNYISVVIVMLLWILSPVFAMWISRTKRNVDKKDSKLLRKISEDTWGLFKEYICKKYNYLIPDNYQEERKEKIANRTSPTNIGLEFIAIMSAYDFKYITAEETIEYIRNILNSIDKLEKYKGNLYNWYNIQTLEKLNDNISSVDNGNYIAYLYVLKSFCNTELNDPELTYRIDKHIQQLDFTILYDYSKDLFSTEYNVRTGELAKSYYDLLASESRILSYVAIAKGDIPYNNWKRLARNQTLCNGKRGLISWSGTAFEYFMPYGILPSFKYSMLEETYNCVFNAQKDYVKADMPWGISESAFYLFDPEMNYQYKAFGIPGLGLKRGLNEDLVISPYSSIMMLPMFPEEVIKNIYVLKKNMVYGKYGFYDAIDYTKNRVGKNRKKVVKIFMAHHQGLIILSINNYLNNNVIQKRFMQNPEMKAYEILLQEKINEEVSTNIPKENKTLKEKYNIRQEKEEQVDYYIDTINMENAVVANVLSNKEYMVYQDNNKIYSKYRDKYIYRKSLIYFREYNKEPISCLEDGEYIYTQYNNVCVKDTEKYEISTEIIVLNECNGEIRNISVRNKTNEINLVELYVYIEPLLSDLNSDKSHRTFNNMSLELEKIENIIVARKRRRDVSEKEYYLGTNVNTDKDINIEYCTDRLWFIGRNGDELHPIAIENNCEFNNEIKTTVEPIVCYKLTFTLQPQEKINVRNVMVVAEDKEECINNMRKKIYGNVLKNEREISQNRSVIENKFYGTDVNEIEEYIKIIALIENKDASIVENKLEMDVSQQNLWRYGISGDRKILTIEIKRKIEIIYVIKLLKAYKYIKRKNILLDLVILVKGETEVSEAITKNIFENINKLMLNDSVNNGIYVLINPKENICDLLKILSIQYITNKKHNILGVVKEKKENTFMSDTIGSNIEYNIDVLEMFNGIGGFNIANDEYVIILKNNTTPLPWINILANREFGVMTSENGIVFLWYKNSGQDKLTRWSADPVKNTPSIFMYISEKDKCWGINAYPNILKDTTYVIIHGKGCTKYISKIEDIYVEQKIYVPYNNNCMVLEIRLVNDKNIKRDIQLNMQIDLLMGNEIQEKIYNIYRDDENIICKNVFSNIYAMEEMYISSSEKNAQYEYIKEENKLRIYNNISLEEKEEKRVIYKIGIKEDQVNNEINLINAYDDLLYKIKIKTPDEKLNILFNNCLLYQTISGRLWGRTGFYQTSGAYGFRDQLQDVLSIMYVDEKMAYEQIVKQIEHQYLEGDVMHWWHEDMNRGIRTRCSDDRLWMVYVVLRYIEITGNDKILEEEVGYIQSSILLENEKDRYEEIVQSEIKESIYMHLIRAIDSIDYGKQGLPNMHSGDWNDGLNNVKGESVWLGFFLYSILNKLLSIVQKRDYKKYEEYKLLTKQIANGLDASWDGKWYKRAYFNTGECLGSSKNVECKIDSISQSWSVISNFADLKHGSMAMESVDKILVDYENKIIKLFTPPFNKDIVEPGYIKAYIPGVRENGGQYTHAAIWNVIAQCILNNGNKAYEYINMLNPIEKTQNIDSVLKYKGEPYVVAADIYSAKDMIGRCGWTYYTGSASWMYICILEYILGFKKNGNVLKIEPCINSSWKEYSIEYMYEETKYNIVVRNEEANQTKVKCMYVDGVLKEENKVILINDKQTHEIICIM